MFFLSNINVFVYYPCFHFFYLTLIFYLWLQTQLLFSIHIKEFQKFVRQRVTSKLIFSETSRRHVDHCGAPNLRIHNDTLILYYCAASNPQRLFDIIIFYIRVQRRRQRSGWWKSGRALARLWNVWMGNGFGTTWMSSLEMEPQLVSGMASGLATDRSLRPSPAFTDFPLTWMGVWLTWVGWERGMWRWNLKWRRPLRECEREGEATLYNLLQQFTLREGVSNSRTWRGSGDGMFTVKTAYNEILKRGGNPTPTITTAAAFDGCGVFQSKNLCVEAPS